jgi:hypothetical protein
MSISSSLRVILLLVFTMCLATMAHAVTAELHDSDIAWCGGLSSVQDGQYIQALSASGTAPQFVPDPGEGTCTESWTESRWVEVTRPNGWYYATVACAGAGGAVTYASGMINPALGMTVAAVFGATCTAMSMEAQYETVTVRQTRTCQRWWDYNFYMQGLPACRTQCSSWQ